MKLSEKPWVGTVTEITQINNVSLYGNDDYAIIKTGEIEWGAFYKRAGEYRTVPRIHKDIPELAATGVLFELVWGVSTHWLWENTTFIGGIAETIHHVSQLPYTEDYGVDESDRYNAAIDIYNFISQNKPVQEKIISHQESRMQKDNPNKKITRLEPDDYTFEFVANNKLFSELQESEFIDAVNTDDRFGFVNNVSEYIDSKFDKSQQQTDDMAGVFVVVPDAVGKPTVRAVESLIDDEVKSKICRMAFYKEWLDVSVKVDYGTNTVSITVSKNDE